MPCSRLGRSSRWPRLPKRLKSLPGKASPVVFQALLPEDRIVLEKSAYKIPAGQTTSIPIFSITSAASLPADA